MFGRYETPPELSDSDMCDIQERVWGHCRFSRMLTAMAGAGAVMGVVSGAAVGYRTELSANAADSTRVVQLERCAAVRDRYPQTDPLPSKLIPENVIIDCGMGSASAVGVRAVRSAVEDVAINKSGLDFTVAAPAIESVDVVLPSKANLEKNIHNLRRSSNDIGLSPLANAGIGLFGGGLAGAFAATMIFSGKEKRMIREERLNARRRILQRQQGHQQL